MDNLPLISSGPQWESELINFINLLKAEPSRQELKVNKNANNSLYLPIGFVEEKLDYFFGGMWQTENFQSTVVVNEVCVSLELVVLHPVARVWIRRVGTGAAMIQLRAERDESGEKISAGVLEVGKKIPNTLVKDFPHAKAEALKNAAKSLGNIFGRNINREDSLSEEIESLDDAEIKIGAIEKKAELLAYYDSLPNAMKSDKRIKKALKNQELFIKGQSNA